MRKYYDDDDDDQSYSEVELPSRSTLPSEYLTKLDGVIALALGAFVLVFLSMFPFPGLTPESWNDAAVASGLRPPSTIMPGLWRVITRGFYMSGLNVGNTALMWGGRLCAAMTAGAAYLLLRSVLSLLVRARLRFSPYRYLVQRIAAGLGALFFACGDSVWRAGQTLVPDSLLVFLTIFQLYLFVSFMLNGKLWKVLASSFLVGLIAADSPYGLVCLAACCGVFVAALRHDLLCANMPLLDPVSGVSVKWRVTLMFSVGFIAGIAINSTSYIVMNGMAANGQITGDLPLAYLLNWWDMLLNTASGIGAVLGLGVCVLPFIVSGIMLPRAADEEQFMPYHVGAVFFFTGIMAFTQLCMLPPLWFWSWSDAVCVNSIYVREILMLAAAGSVTFSLTTLGVDVCCRNHECLAQIRYGELRGEGDDGEHGGEQMVVSGKRGGIVILVVAGLLLTCGVVPGRALTRTREMLGIMDDYVKEVVEECGSVGWIFTDGSFDSVIELKSAQRGRRINAISMMGGNAVYQQYLRSRGVRDKEDLMTCSLGAPMTLRSWMRDKPERMKEAATQLGFELWKRDGKELPVCSGVLARPIGMSDEDCNAGVERTKKIAEKILDIYSAGGLEKAAGKKIRELFLFVQWRISRLARMRAERADRAGDTQNAMTDVKLSDKLDQANESLQSILKDVEKQRATTLKQVTPRESLQLALARADFALARRYGEIILNADPNDSAANFGVGMSYVMLKQWSRAEEYLRRGLIKNPSEPAMWNNLAMVYMYQEKFDVALKCANKALQLIPESAEVKETIKSINAAKEKAAKRSNKN